MSKDWTLSQLDAGGFASLDAKVDEKSTETMVARAYGAAVLGDRKVIRLTSERLAPAEDLSMEFLGLEPRSMSQPFARQNRTALEFGHWALIHQPKNAKYALDLVKRMKGAARKAASKAGHAWDLYTQMAEELNKSVRHFLPPFWEQAARAYKDLGNAMYAGRALSKALEAERVHSLEVDREHRRDAILEFTLSGCLTGKALTEYAKDLEKQFPPREAYETFKDLIIRRTLGGMPPLATSASDLSKMAKSAELDANAEIEEFLHAIIASPAMVRAPNQFWKSVKKQVGSIVARNPSFAVWLLVHTNTESDGWSDSRVWEWLDLLDEWQVLPYLSMPAEALPIDVEIPGGRSGWISRLASVELSPNKRVFELIEQMKEVLAKEGEPIQLRTGYQFAMDVDTLEMILELGLEIAIPTKNFQLSFEGWCREEIDHPRRNSSLSHLCKHELFRRKLLESMTELTAFRGDKTQSQWGRKLPPRRSFDEAAKNHEPVKEIWWSFIDKLLTTLESGALGDFELAQETLSKSCHATTAAEFPELVERLRKLDVGACLHRTLNAGVMDEYGWEELDRAADKHTIRKETKRGDTTLFSSYPYLIWKDADKLYSVSPTTFSTADILLKSGQNARSILPVGSQFAILYYDSNNGWKTYLQWTSAPDESFEQSGDHYQFNSEVEALISLGDDSVFTGLRIFREGDTTAPAPQQNWFYDGERFWRAKREMYGSNGIHEFSVHEIDPLTGSVIRKSIPPFVEEEMPSSSTVLWHFTYLIPKPPQPGASPLGEMKGLLGSRCVRRRDGAIETSGIDGRSWTFSEEEQPLRGHLAAEAIVSKPCSEDFWIVASDGRVIDSDSKKCFSLRLRSKYFAGSPCDLPLRFMNSLRVRCEATSKALRSLNRESADRLLEGGAREHAALRTSETSEATDELGNDASRVVQELFPEAPPRLVKGIARIARIAAEEQNVLESILKRLNPDEAASHPSSMPTDSLVQAGFSELVIDVPQFLPTYFHSQNLGNHLLEVAKFFAGENVETVPNSGRYWLTLMEDLPAVAWRTFWSRAIREDESCDVRQRVNGGWVRALRLFADSGLMDLPGRFAIFGGTYDPTTTKMDELIKKSLAENGVAAFVEGSTRYLAYQFQTYPNNYLYILGYAAHGDCKAPRTMTFEITKDVVPKWSRDQLISFLDSISKLEKLPLPSLEKLNDASRRLNLHPIAVALQWMGNVRTSLYGQEKLTKELREFYGWKVKDIQAALLELNGWVAPQNLYDSLLKDPIDLFARAEQIFEVMINDLESSLQAFPPLPPEITKEIDRAFSRYTVPPLRQINELIMAPEDCEILKPRKVNFSLANSNRYYTSLTLELNPKPSVDLRQAYHGLVKVFSIINSALPTGHPVRKQLPLAIEATRDFLNRPDTKLSLGQINLNYDAQKTTVEAFVTDTASSIGRFERDANGIYLCRTDTIEIAMFPPNATGVFFPSKVTTQKDADALVGMLQAIQQNVSYAIEMNNTAFAIKMRSEGMDEIVESNRHPQIEEGRWDQNPLHSVPKLVAECAKKLKVDESSAAYYLQILALTEPTNSNLKIWNGWDSKMIQSCASVLLESQLLIQAKRERAGREYFLPGGWETLKAPNLPLETWKLPLYGCENKEQLRGYAAELIVYEGAISTLFKKAWDRWKSGDVPAYEEAPIKPAKKKK